MISKLIFVLSALVCVQCQIFATPYPRQVAAAMPNCQCGGPVPVQAVMPNCQCGAPVPLPTPIMKPNCQCGGPAPMPAAVPVINVPYEMPVPVAAPPPRVIVNQPMGCLEPTVTKYGTIAEVPVPAPMPLPYANPYLPAASPVSALAPFSPYLPPANTCSKCQYLKKIPIPPPYI